MLAGSAPTWRSPPSRQMHLPVPVPSKEAQQVVSSLLNDRRPLKAALRAAHSQGLLSKPPLAGWADVTAEAAAPQAAEERAAQLSLSWPLQDRAPADAARRAVWEKRRATKLAARAGADAGD